MTYPSVIERQRQKSFITAREKADPGSTKVLLKGRSASSLGKSELLAIATALGYDPKATTMDTDTDTNTDTDTDADANTDADTDTEETSTDDKLTAIKELLFNGGFNAADDTLRQLIIDASKPAEVVEVPASGTNGQAGPAVVSKPTTITRTWSQLFGVKGDLGKKTSTLWDGVHPLTPKTDDTYVWPQPLTGYTLTQLARHQNIFNFGPPGTGKNKWVEQLAARLGRPFVLISCDDQTDGPTLVGMTVPSADGGTVWQDGILTRAIQIPGCVICIDEPSVARAGALLVMQNVLEHKILWLSETGRRVHVARGVAFFANDNTNGTGGGAAHGLAGTGQLNGAFLERFAAFVNFNYLPPDKEAGVIMARTNCTRALADLLIGAATTTRQEADKGALVSGIGLRRLIAWAGMLTDGIDPRAAFELAILNAAPAQDREALTQQCLLTYSASEVARALGATSTTAETLLEIA